MSVIPFSDLVKQVQQLSPAEKAQLALILEEQNGSNGNGETEPNAATDADDQQKKSGYLAPGWAKGMILHMSEDFDEPLEDFKEYM